MSSSEHPIAQLYGRTTILDKSAFEGLSLQEASLLSQHCQIIITPILVTEVIADLSKLHEDGRLPHAVVQALAKRLSWSHGWPNMDFATLCLNSLDGRYRGEIGKFVPDNATYVPDGDGYGIYVDNTQFSSMLLRWKDGEFTDSEGEFATRWRAAARTLDVRRWDELLLRHRVITPRVKTDGDLIREARRLLGDRALAEMWVELLLDQLNVPALGRRRLEPSLSAHVGIPVTDWAPYAGHCLKAIVYFILATRSGLLPARPTNLIDLQYLFYTPFCMLFVSDDKMHKRLAPMLLVEGQSFMTGSELKRLLSSAGQAQ